MLELKNETYRLLPRTGGSSRKPEAGNDAI